MAEDKLDFPLDLKQVYFTKLIVEAIAGHADLEQPNPQLTHPPENKLNVQEIPDEKNSYAVMMNMVINPDKDPADPYFIEAECIAIFLANERLSSEEAKRGVTITGHNVVYGAIREAISWITGRHPYGALSVGLSVLTPKKDDEKKSA